MTISVFELFKIGIGPSSSHTVGPMIASCRFVQALADDCQLSQTVRVKVQLFGSLGATGRAHGTTKAILLGLEGSLPASIDINTINERLATVRQHQQINLANQHLIQFKENSDLILHKRKSLPYHSNGMMFEAFDANQQLLAKKAFYSVGGGFVVDADNANEQTLVTPLSQPDLPHPFSSGKQLLALCQKHKLNISQLMLENEKALKPESQIYEELMMIWQTMRHCVKRGCQTEGVLPGGLQVKRRAPGLYQRLQGKTHHDNPLVIIDWVNVYAIAVNEENAAGGRIVTAPTNGAAGIIPAVLHYYAYHQKDSTDEGIIEFLLTAAAIGSLFKENASISGAEVGCQGEVGSACSMAAAGLAQVSGATPEQVENAAEIAMEHHLGLTCDPIGGLVQIPCIERNAIGANKAINAVRLALAGQGQHFVSLDKVIKTMHETGRDMKDKYKETARGGLATNVIEIPINIVEC